MEEKLPRLVQIEIPVSDTERAHHFYSQVFGWHKTPTDIHNYYVLDVPKHFGFGVALIPTPGSRKSLISTMIYFECENREETLKQVTAAHGRIVHGPRHIPPYGEVYTICDPDENKWGLFFS